MRHLYLDFNSTTPLAPSVSEAMTPFWEEHFLLPTQEHSAGRVPGELLDEARESVARMIDCDPFEIVFTSGGTEANNLAIIGACRALREAGQEPGEVIVSANEHESVVAAAESLEFEGWTIKKIGVDNSGLICADEVEEKLSDATRLVCVQAACAISGVLQPVRQIADICHARGVLLHCDAAQVAGKYPLSVTSLRADMVTLSGHKMYGPKGVGALYVRRGLRLAPIMYGEIEEMGLRPGAANIPGAIGLGSAANLIAAGVEDAADNMGVLRDRFEQRVTQAIPIGPIVLGTKSARLPNTSLLQLPTKPRLRPRKALPDLVVTTARCAAPEDWMTRCLREMGLKRAQIARCIRVSIGWTTSQDLIDAAADQIVEALDIE